MSLPSTPLLVSRFDLIQERPEGVVITVELFPDIFSDDDYRRHCSEEEKKSWNFVFQKEKTLNYLTAAPTEEKFAYLRNVRKFGLILRSAYNFFSANHESPEVLHRFIKDLGDYNDRYWLLSRETIIESILERKDFERLGEDDLQITYASKESFQEYAENVLSDITICLRKNPCNIQEFHTLRKDIRFFKNLLQVPAAEHMGGSEHLLFSSLYQLSEKLGVQHDVLVQKSLRNEVDHEHVMVGIDPEIEKEFNAAYPFIKKALGIL